MSQKESVEDVSRRRARRNSIERAILAVLSASAVATVAIVAPKVLTLLKNSDPSWIVPKNPQQRIKETMYRLRKKGWVQFEKGKPLQLTVSGKRKVADIHSGVLSINRPLRWDGRWRVLIFDIQEKYAASRSRLRALLERLNFVRLQDSVWVHPYNCEEIVALIKLDAKLRNEVLYIVANAIENDLHLRSHFNLSASR